ncbi:MAG: GxxExxY protein [Planctomycetota bacterium]
MHPLYEQAAGMTHDVIGAAIEVHKDKGPGLLESIYEWCFAQELELRGYDVRAQKSVVIRYRRFQREELLKFDVLVNSCLLVEVKAVETVHPIHKAQLLSYMKLLDIPLGLLINFNVERLTEGVSRLILLARILQIDSSFSVTSVSSCSIPRFLNRRKQR